MIECTLYVTCTHAFFYGIYDSRNHPLNMFVLKRTSLQGYRYFLKHYNTYHLYSTKTAQLYLYRKWYNKVKHIVIAYFTYLIRKWSFFTCVACPNERISLWSQALENSSSYIQNLVWLLHLFFKFCFFLSFVSARYWLSSTTGTAQVWIASYVCVCVCLYVSEFQARLDYIHITCKEKYIL